MLHIVKSPGSCGELLQGSIGGQHFLVTCPINRYSYALSNEKLLTLWPILKDISLEQLDNLHESNGNTSNFTSEQFLKLIHELNFDHLKSKGQAMAKLLGFEQAYREQILCASQLPIGKGLASSSADLSAIALAFSLLQGKTLNPKDIGALCLQIEPTDASFYPGIVQFDYISGIVTRELGSMPSMQLLVFDTGGMIDTVSFNAQPDLAQKIKQKEGSITEAFALLVEGLQKNDPWRIGAAATMSAKANQSILYKSELETCIELSKELNSYGIIIAHSGTIVAFMFPTSMDLAEAKTEVLKKCPTLAYFDTVNTTNEGITYDTIDTIEIYRNN